MYVNIYLNISVIYDILRTFLFIFVNGNKVAVFKILKHFVCINLNVILLLKYLPFLFFV